MRRGRRSPFVALAVGATLLPAPLTSAANADAGTPRWHAPNCTTVKGAHGTLSFTADRGAHLRPTRPALNTGASGRLVALRQANTLIGLSGGEWLVSTDAGCTWKRLAATSADDSEYQLVGGQSSAYAYSPNHHRIVRVDAQRAVTLNGPVRGDGIVGLSIDAASDQHLTAVSRRGTVFRSRDGGRSWTRIGTANVDAQHAVVTNDGRHIVVGAFDVGVVVSNDGGKTWSRSAGIATRIAKVNIFTVVTSPVDARIVWAEGISLADFDHDRPARKIWRSTDGGAHFRVVVTEAKVKLTNGVVMTPDPRDRSLLHVTFGTWYDDYGTDLYTLDARTGRVRTRHHAVHGVTSLAFNPAAPGVIYVGLDQTR